MKIRLSVLLVFAAFHCQSQTLSSLGDSCPRLRGVIAFVEAGGPGHHQSLNMEKVLFRVSPKVLGAVRIGYGVRLSRAIHRTPFFSIPIGISLIRGVRRHKIEAGLNLSLMQNRSIDYRRDRGLYFIPSIGYRYQKESSGFFCKVAFTVNYKIYDWASGFDQRGGETRNYGGLGLGYYFARAK